jgi:hypothetical protein
MAPARVPPIKGAFDPAPVLQSPSVHIAESRFREGSSRRPACRAWVRAALVSSGVLSSGVLSASVLSAGSGVLLGCAAPDEQIVARESPPPPVPPPVEPLPVAPPPPVSNRPRQRVQVVGGELRSDIGTPLRGLLAPVDSDWSLPELGLLDSIAQTTGLNTIHVYLENWTQVTGAGQSQADALVSLTAQAGLYLVLGIGGGPDAADHPGTGWFDIEKVRSFWSLYAPRYKDSPHVLFEVQNHPEITCSEPMQAQTIEMEREMYTLIRSLAPDTHIILFSTVAIPQPSVLSDAIVRVSDIVDWSNASVAVHSDRPCVPLTDVGGVVDTARAAGVPLLVSQLPDIGWEPHVAVFEQYELGWLHLHWFANDLSVPALVDDTARAGLGWCPDQGTFPLVADTCRPQ